MLTQTDVIVIGGGLSGLMAGLTAAERGLRVIVLDCNEVVGGKYCYTSMGAGALTNTGMDVSRFTGRDSRFVTDALSAFDASAVRDWFASRGVDLSDAEYYGLVQPAGGGDAVAALVTALEDAGGELHTSQRVTGVEPTADGFTVQTETAYSTRAVVLATGGANLPQLGGSTAGYEIAAGLGHRCEPVFPAHVGITVRDDWPESVAGLWMEVELTPQLDGRPVATGVRAGSMLFTQSGLTGEAVFNISGLIESNLERGIELSVNFHPTMSAEDVAEWMFRVFGERSREPADRAIDYLIPAALGRILLARQKLKAGSRVMQMSEEQRSGLLSEMLATRWQVKGTLGMRAAESCVGGVSVRETDPRTMASRRVPGLYVVGRVLDVSADWGGFEQHFSLASGRLAGLSLLQ